MHEQTPKQEPLPRAFYERDPILVARELLGKVLVRHIEDVRLSGKIVETEAYLGVIDPAAHSSTGKTKRTTILFEGPGLAYVYQLRAYYLLNATTEPEGTPTCVLLRALEPLEGTDFIREHLGPLAREETKLMNGPGKLCRALQINLSHYGVDLCSHASPLYITQGTQEAVEIEASPRIGITKAVEFPYRFTVRGSPYLSR